MLSQRSLGAAGKKDIPVDDEFNRVSFLSHFDGSNNGTNNVFDDSSSSNHTITANGDVTQGSFGPFARPDGEWSVAFDGSSDSLTFTNDSGMSLDGDYTFELWFNASSIVLDTQHPNIIIIGTTQLFVNSTSKFVSLYDSGADIVKSANDAIEENEWYHVAAVRSGAGTNNTSLYLNGTRVAQATNTATLGASSGTGRIGSYSGTGGDFNGHISNIRLVKGTALYSGASITVPTSPLTAVTNTKLLTCQSNRFVDNSSSAHTITPSGDTAVSAFGPFLTSEVYDAGVNGASSYFDGSDGLSSSASTDYEFGTGDVTVEYWAYPTASGAIQNILDNRAEASGWKLGRNASNQFQVYNEVTSSYLFESGTFPENAWSHFCWTRASGVNKFFINGVQSGSNVSDSSNFNSNSLNIGVQHGGTTQYFTGYITCCRVIKGTAVEPSGVPTSPPTAVTNTKLLLNMADGQAIDSAAQNNLTLVGDAKISNAQSKFGGTSLYFDGTGDEATYSSTGFGTGDFTMEAWVYPQTQPQRFPAVYFVTNGSSDRVAVAFDHDSQPNKFRCNVAGTVLSPSGTNAVDQWYHTAVVRYQGVITFYLNGTSVGSTAYTHNVGPETSFLGGNSPRSSEVYFKGFLDDFRVSKTARYTANFTPPTEPFADKGQ
jgi:hypothetical protein